MALSLLLQDLRTQSYETYLCCLYTPKHIRETLAALHLAHLEIGRAIDVGEETMPGFIRLQWWRDALESTTPSEHLVMRTLQPAFQDGRLAKAQWDSMITARETVLESGRVTDHGLYIEQTYGILLQQAAFLAENASQENAKQAGIAWGSVQVLRSLMQQEKIPPSTVTDPIAQLAETAFSECHPFTPMTYPAKLAQLYYRRYTKDKTLLQKPLSAPRCIWHLTLS